MKGFVLALLLLAVTPVVATAAEPVVIPWTEYLPALPSPAGTKGGPVPHCKKATIKCVDREIRLMRRARERFGCDHRAVFATTYLELTKEIRETLRDDRDFFADRRALIYEDVIFADVYFRTLRRYERGKTIDGAWKVAMDVAAHGDYQGVGDMLLGINAHVQNDMPFVLAALTIRDAKGNSRKPDHDAVNNILNRAFEGVVKQVSARYDPFTAFETWRISPASDYFGIEMVRLWREGVWRNAERLVNAKSEDERKAVAESIHFQAEATARAIQAAALAPPGYRAQRDAYCAA